MAEDDTSSMKPRSYEVTDGSAFKQIWQVDFTNLNLILTGGVLQQFGVQGRVRNPDVNDPVQIWYNHASNAALSGTTQDGSDGTFLGFDLTQLSAGGSPIRLKKFWTRFTNWTASVTTLLTRPTVPS